MNYRDSCRGAPISFSDIRYLKYEYAVLQDGNLPGITVLAGIFRAALPDSAIFAKICLRTGNTSPFFRPRINPEQGRGDDLTAPSSIGDGLGNVEKQIMPWLILVIAGLFEIGWAIGLKYTDGFTRLWPTVGTLGAMLISVVLLGLAMKSLPVGTAYAVWTGIGTVGTVILGMVLLGEAASAVRVVCIMLIVAGIIGLKVFSPT